MKKVEPETPKKHFTLAEIEVMHMAYDSERVLEVLKDGKWTVQATDMSGKNIEGTAARQKFVKDTIDFPKYLRDKCLSTK
jgi:hypothetical protein